MTEEETTQEQNENIQEEKEKDFNKTLKSTLKWVSGIVVILLIVILSVYKSNNPDFSTGSFVLFLGGTFVFGALIWKGQDIWEKLSQGGKDKKDKDELPEPMDVKDLEGFIRKTLRRREYLDDIDGIDRTETRNLGHGKVSTVAVAKIDSSRFDRQNYRYFVVNMHYPEKYQTIVKSKKELTSHEINRIADLCSISPEGEPLPSEIDYYDDFGRLVSRKRESKKPSKKKANKSEQKDLK